MSAINVKPSGPRMTKKARERKHEADKAEKALGGGQLKDASATPHWYVELQWFKLLRGQSRLNQIARILVELSPDKVFDPRDIYASTLKDEEAAKKQQGEASTAPDKGGKGKKGKKEKKLSKKEQIIAANKAKQQAQAIKRDQEKLNNLGAKAGGNVKLKTENGRLMLLLNLLKSALKEKNTVDVLDTMWELEEVMKEIGAEGCKTLVKQYAKEITKAMDMRGDKSALKKKNLIDFQLTEMSDRLPPLNLHSLSGKFKLDAWQRKVIELVNERRSVLISAPTSSGKTVLSTFVCTSGGRVLFVVPTEPLAWQVAAMLRALKLDIALVVPTLNFVPPKFEVVVGTPHSLESTLTKQIGFDFDYAIFDEVHSLNNECGPAIQRLIRVMPPSCRFLALSATIGNVDELTRWWKSLAGQDDIELVVHSSRFINLQRHIWSDPKTEENKKTGSLQFLHPCMSLSVDFLVEHGFSDSDLAFTPVDTYRLYEAIKKECKDVDDLPFKTKSLKPDKFFSNDEQTRVTLQQAKEYEDFIKEHLVILSRFNKDLARKVLGRLAPDSSEAAVDGAVADESTSAVDGILAGSKATSSPESLTNLMLELRDRQLTPSIAFQLDSVWCQELFDGLLRELEQRESATYPEYRKGLEKSQEMAEKLSKASGKKGGRKNDDASEVEESQQFGESGSSSVDVDAPHPDFALTPPGRGIGAVEALDIQSTLRGDLPPTGDLPHPLIRGLRRGIGLYITGLPSAYHRIVQAFAQRGRLGVVLSDELLAYGVNMPFRSTVFYGDPGQDWLTPLLHQQMAGRAGRRGLDRLGHLVYSGFDPERVKELLRGNLPAVEGRFPLYPTIPLQLAMNESWEVSGTALNRDRMIDICSTPLAEFLKGETVENYFEVAEKWVAHLGMLEHKESSYKHLIPELIWELRQFVPESLALEYLLEPIIKTFSSPEAIRRDADTNLQRELFLVFCRFCSRQRLSDVRPESLDAVEWIGALPAPNKPDEEWDRWTALLAESQARITESDLEFKENLLLPVPLDVEVDNECYSSFVRNQIDPHLPTKSQHFLRERLWNIGEILRVCSNVLSRSAELQPVQNVIRKCFVRCRYILDETFERNWKNEHAHAPSEEAALAEE